MTSEEGGFTERPERFDSVGEYRARAVAVLRRDGPLGLMRRGIPFVHDRIVRPRLPRVYETTYNGVTVRPGKPLDGVLPWVDDGPEPDHESGLVDAADEHVQRGDDVVIVGGGWGVTTVHVARQVGPAGSVVVYEGAASSAEKAAETARRNGVEDRVEIRHAVVETAVALRGDPEGADAVDAAALPDCDVLVLDCEGAETEILPALEVDPRTIAVESHGHYGAPSDAVTTALSELGYEVATRAVADEGTRKTCVERDIYVLVGGRD